MCHAEVRRGIQSQRGSRRWGPKVEVALPKGGLRRGGRRQNRRGGPKVEMCRMESGEPARVPRGSAPKVVRGGAPGVEGVSGPRVLRSREASGWRRRQGCPEGGAGGGLVTRGGGDAEMAPKGAEGGVLALRRLRDECGGFERKMQKESSNVGTEKLQKRRRLTESSHHSWA